MTQSTLSHEERQLLNDVVRNRDPALGHLVDELCRGSRLTVDEANTLRDAIGDELARTGVDEEVGAINERGRRLDDLIDRVAALNALYDA
jgi:hypothetical protein